jgi:anhydro-N-acetylmuramic acid kinase
MKSKANYKVIGVMSGTSLDGMDIALCHFSYRKKWKFEILSARTIPYSSHWKESLASAHLLPGNELVALDAAYGTLIGGNCTKFIATNNLKNIDAIASHGHTIFHETSRRFTFQIGNGSALYAKTGIPVVYDFRSLDVALKGEGAPLVPVGDRHLFGKYDVCLNLGGIANLSFEKKEQRIAFDVCFANMGLNYLAGKSGKLLDEEGKMARAGHVQNELLQSLKTVYGSFSRRRPSLGREGFEKDIKNLLNNEAISLPDRLRTFCESIGDEIARSIPSGKLKIMVSGGGALNSFLMEVIQQKTGKAKVVFPSRQIIEFKEALVFAFLGVLRLRGEINVLKSVTRATADSCSGVMVGPVYK